MPTRRNFFNYSALLGTAAHFPVHYALAQNRPAQTPQRDPLFIEPHSHIRVGNPTPRTITIPDVGNYKVYKGDFHMHTLLSDGDVMPRDRVREARLNGLDVISITDHIEIRPFIGSGALRLAANNDDHNAAYNMAKPEADRNNITLIRGTEITKMVMPPGHFNAIFIKDANAIAAVVDDWKKMLEVAADQGAFIFWNHPGWVAPEHGGLARGVPMAFTEEHEEVRQKGHLHGIEVFNDTSHYPIVSDWCNELDLGIVAVSDAHQSELQMYGLQNPRRPITLVLAEDRTEEAIREAFFAHRTIGWVADMIFGRPECVQKLFVACAQFIPAPAHPPGGAMINRSDIPMNLKIGMTNYVLPPQGQISVRLGRGDKVEVTNWFVGTYKPLTVTLGDLSQWQFED
jgi:histidinol phosphatase-like PHP family hydrolase